MTKQIPTETNPESQHRSAELRGGYPLIEPQKAHESLFSEKTGFNGVVLKLHHAKQILNRGEDASTYPDSSHRVITTTTVDDSRLKNLSWQEERDLVQEFRPDYHIPTDYPVYESDSVSVREQNIKKCMQGTEWMLDELSDMTTTVLPLIKGVTPGEREMCYKMYQDRDLDQCIFYGTQYFTSGPGFSQLRRDIQDVASEAPWLSMMVMGLFAPHYLSKLPPQVVAASGLNKWRCYSDLRELPTQLSRKRVQNLSQEVEAAVGQGQAQLSMWANSMDAEVVS